MVAWSHSPSSRYRLLSTDVPRGPLFGLTSETETSRLLVWSHRDTRQVSNYRRSIPYHLSTRSSIMAFRPTRIILRMVRARTIRGSLPFSLRIWKNSYFRKNRSLNDHRIVGEKEIIGCFSNSRVSINEAMHWVSLRVVCTNVDSSLSLNSALRVAEHLSAYLLACADKISRAQPAPKSERRALRCHNRISLKYPFQLNVLEASFRVEQVKYASIGVSFDVTFFLLGVYLKWTNL